MLYLGSTPVKQEEEDGEMGIFHNLLIIAGEFKHHERKPQKVFHCHMNYTD